MVCLQTNDQMGVQRSGRLARATRRAAAFRGLSLPYGVWTTSNGREVTFNRRYQPLHSRASVDSEVCAADPTEWLQDIVQTVFLYSDATPEKEKQAAGRRLLRLWGLPAPSNARTNRLRA